MENLYLWVGLGLVVGLIAIISISVKTGKRRAREVEELNQHFPEAINEPLTVDKMRRRRRPSQKADSVVETGLENDVETNTGEEAQVEVSHEPHTKAIDPEQGGQDEQADDLKRPVRYKRSIFHPDHLKKEENDSKPE